MENMVRLRAGIKELEEELHQAACDISHLREQHHDDCKLVIELRELIKDLRQSLANCIKT